MRLAVLSIAVLLGSCAGFSSAPSRYNLQAVQMVDDLYGCWIDVNVADADGKLDRFAGELLAISEDSLFVLTNADSDAVRVVSRPAVVYALVTKYRPASYHYAWMSGGAILLSAIATGAGSVFVFPGYVLVALVGAASSEWSRWQTYEQGDPMDTWLELGAYARFPQGLLADIPRATLRLK
jgi:hypothetical protein